MPLRVHCPSSSIGRINMGSKILFIQRSAPFSLSYFPCHISPVISSITFIFLNGSSTLITYTYFNENPNTSLKEPVFTSIEQPNSLGYRLTSYAHHLHLEKLRRRIPGRIYSKPSLLHLASLDHECSNNAH